MSISLWSMGRRRRGALALTGALGAALMTLTGCGAGADAAAADGRIQVAAAFYPLQFVAEQVGGERVAVTSLTRPGAEPHDLELAPRQVGQIEDADLVVYEKGFQPAVDEAVDQNRTGPVVEAGRVVHLVGSDPSAGLDPVAAHDGEAPAEDVPATHGDPHFWQDPSRLARLSSAVAAALGKADPGHAATYRDNALRLNHRLDRLDTTLRRGLQSCARRVFVTSHAAFGYLARRYGLQMVGVSGLTPDSEPSPARLRAVQDAIRRHGVTTVFSETLLSPKVAQTLASDLGVRAEVLDPLEGLAPDAPPGSDYFSLMRANLRALRRANGCT